MLSAQSLKNCRKGWKITPCVMIEVIPTVAIQNKKNSTIALCWGYRAQAVVLLAEVVALLAVDVDDAAPLLQVGQL